MLAHGICQEVLSALSFVLTYLYCQKRMLAASYVEAKVSLDAHDSAKWQRLLGA